MRRKGAAAFTLVELLVVIAIIALLVSLLLPALGKARAQANSLNCASNLRSIGQLMNLYAAENRGFLPYGYGAAPVANPLQEWNWPDTLTLLNAPQIYASIQVPANGYWPPVSQSNQSADLLPIFHDTDTPDVPWATHSCGYNGNPRLLPDATSADPMHPGNLFQHRAMGSVDDAASKMLVWDGALNIYGGSIYGTSNYVDKSIDDGCWNSTTYSYGTSCSMTSPYEPAAQYSTPVAPGVGANGANSGWANSVTKSVQIVENQDDVSSQYYNAYGLRYRHNNNTSCNALFVDGHVERKAIGEVLVLNICVNP
jgi:prepilin-type processing-associated H-X9-DG protein/prepilin-type N-terminal cleavage/methylation domain-containing protein